jgi:hypothetical protein
MSTKARQTVFGEKNMRYALIIAMLVGSTLLAQALDRDKWVGQTGRANKTCLAKFRQKFGEAKDHNYADCVADQTNKEIDTCIGNSEFSNCVFRAIFEGVGSVRPIEMLTERGGSSRSSPSCFVP